MTGGPQRVAPDLPGTSWRWLIAKESVWRGAAFVLRCVGAASLAYLLASLIGLPHPVWAVMSALIVSQEKLEETNGSLKARILGTIIGVAAGVAAALAAPDIGLGITGQVAVSVAACAVVARLRPALRVCMWTGPIVLLTAAPGETITTVALYRGSEVVLGALIGGALHWAAENTMNRLLKSRLGAA